ncbi:hypothetical protein GF378_00590 [Candidatus Pacearchaeota archaeon]|nr:hypothetical protein [Candidatus Pacearchaeota archaeon]
MKKRILSAVLFTVLLVFAIALGAAQNETDQATATDAGTATATAAMQEKIDNAYSCLEQMVSGKCATLSPEEKLFTLLAIGECKDEVIADSVSEEYWTSVDPSIKTTAQAILALGKSTNFNTDPAEQWLLSKQGSPEDVDWYLQIESDEETSCTIKYDGLTHNVQLKEDKTLSEGAGNCLTLSNNDYWLKITPGCYDREFEVSCDEDFLTALLFKRQASSVIHISDTTNSASAGGRTTEKVNSACFLEDGECTYEGTLWAAVVLGYEGHDTTPYLPYLTTMAEENSKFLPESFLYILTGSNDYRTELLSRQINNKYWDTYKDKFYDTAFALYSISDAQEKQNSKDWLLDSQVQGTNGCWQSNVRNTAFILASIFPRQIDTGSSSCEGSGYYCMSEVNCVGSLLDTYACPGVLKCCDSPKPVLPCEEQTGKICGVDENCVGGTVMDASDTATGETCCVGGTCEVPAPEAECESYGGTCRAFGCNEGEEEAFYACEFEGDYCCVESTEQEGGGGWGWIILLIILILLTILGIVFRKKLKPLWQKILSKFKKGKGPKGPKGPGGPGRPFGPGPGPSRPGPGASGRPRPGSPPVRRVFPQAQKKKGSIQMSSHKEQNKEVEKALSKLKDMAKKK